MGATRSFIIKEAVVVWQSISGSMGACCESVNLQCLPRDMVEMCCAIWCYLCYLKNVTNTLGETPLLVLKVTLLRGCFSRFLNCINGTQTRKASQSAKCHAYDLDMTSPKSVNSY